MDLISTTEASAILGLTDRQTRRLAESGQLPGRQVGRAYLFDRPTVEQFAAIPRPGPGRPAKKAEKTRGK